MSSAKSGDAMTKNWLQRNGWLVDLGCLASRRRGTLNQGLGLNHGGGWASHQMNDAGLRVRWMIPIYSLQAPYPFPRSQSLAALLEHLPPIGTGQRMAKPLMF